MTFPLLTLTVFAPLVGALFLLALPNKDGEQNGLVRNIALGISLVVFALTVAVWGAFDGTSADFQFVERVPWIPAFGIEYHLGVDGISLWLVVLTGFLTPLALLSSWHGVDRKVKEFCFFILVLETGDDRRVRLARPVPLLHLLGRDAHPDVLPDRDLGLRPARLRGGQVHPLHDGRAAC